MIKKYLFFIMVLITSCAIKAQTVITLEKTGGVYKIPCVINGLKLKLIFDTGASSVCISESLASMMLENGYLSENDIKGTSQSQVADGRIVNNTNINIKKLEIGDKVLNNVEAVVIEGQSAPLLLGQSAIKRLGEYSISNDKLILGSRINKKSESNIRYITPLDSLNIHIEGLKFYTECSYNLALEKFQILYDNEMLNIECTIAYANCYYYLDDISKALDIYLEIEETENTFLDNHRNIKSELFSKIGDCLRKLEDYSAAISYYKRSLHNADIGSNHQKYTIFDLCSTYKDLNYTTMGQAILDDYIHQYLVYMEIKATDCWDKYYSDKYLADLYYFRYLFSTSESDYDKFSIISAAWGNKDAIEICKKFELNYTSKPYKYEY